MKNEFLNKVKFALQRSTITLIINKEKKIEYKDIVYEKGAIAYEELINPFKENPEQKFDDDKDKEFQNYKKLIKFLDKIKEITNKSISESNLSNLEQELRIEIKLQRDINQSNDDYINSEYILEKSFSKLDKYQDKDVLNNDNYRYFILFSTKIINNPQISSIQKNSSIIGNGSSTNKNEKDIIDKINELYKYRFIIFKKVIGKHRQIAEKIREVNNGLFVSDGYNEIFKYNTDYEKQNGNNNFENYYSFFVEENDVLISQKNIFRFLSKCDDNNSSIKTEFSCRNLFNLKNHTLIICDENKVYCSYNLKDFATTKQNFVLYEKAYRGGIKINDDLLAITSNNILSKGENKLIFFHQISKLFLGEFEVKDYSFILSENNCALMKIPKQENDKLLLVACKKYRKKDENGILLLKLQLNKNKKKKKNEEFYPTENFEVYCFCPLLKIENKLFLKNNDKAQINETEYFFVGGFDLDKGEGLIKLYKVIYDKEIEKIEIKYIRDIIVGKNNVKEDSKCFKGFKGPISCMIQSSTGEILVTCYDGNVYLFSEPNFDSLNQDYDIL